MKDSTGIIERISALMAEYPVEPTPSNYEFLYRYVTGADPQLEAAVDGIRERRGSLSQGAINSIRRDLYGAGTAGVDRVLEDTERQLARVSDVVEKSDAGARDYRDTLGRSQMASGTSLKDQRALLFDILEATSNVIAQQEMLLAELAGSAQEIDLLKAELEIARVESRSDALTGLAVRRACTDYLDAQMAIARTEATALSLVFIDIDHFKAFNDLHGHRIGDEVLRLVAQSLEQCFHGNGFVARWGGEEFVVVLPGHRAGEAAERAEACRRLISSRPIRAQRAGTAIGRITLSLGVAEFTAGDTAQTLVERADRALYDAKADGRDRVVTWQDAA